MTGVDAAKSQIMALLEPENRDWAKFLRIPALFSKGARSDVVEYLFTLCTSIFIDFKPYVEDEPADDNDDSRVTARRVNKLKHVRAIFDYYGIQSPAHWSPILSIRPDSHGDQMSSLVMFNEAIKHLKYYLTPNQEFRKDLAKDIEARYARCEGLANELEGVANEDRFYRDKFKRLQEFVNSLAENKKLVKERETVNNLIERLFDPNPPGYRSRSLTTY